MTLFDNPENPPNGAIFSDDRRYRFCLWRKWDENGPFVMFVGLNPSTANETGDDPTIRRVKAFAKQWGFGGVYMMNLFTYVGTDPAQMQHCGEYELRQNDEWLRKVAHGCSKIIFAWGNFEVAHDRGKEVCDMFPQAYCLLKNSNGSPRHPLYVPATTVPTPYK